MVPARQLLGIEPAVDGDARRWLAPATDLGLVIVALSLTIAEWGGPALITSVLTEATRVDTAALVAAILWSLPLLIRRRWPWVGFAATSVVCGLATPLHLRLSNAELMVSLIMAYSVVLHARRARPWLVLVLATISIYPNLPVAALGPVEWIVGGALVSFVVFAGTVQRQRRQLAAMLTKRAEIARLTRDVQVRSAIARERGLIVRELQQMVVDALSRMAPATRRATRQLREGSERATESITSIEDAGREALARMRRLLSVLRRGGEAPGALLVELDPPTNAWRGRVTDRLPAPFHNPGVQDVALAAALSVLAVADSLYGQTYPPPIVAGPVATLVSALIPIPLVARRRWPGPTLFGVVTLVTWMALFHLRPADTWVVAMALATYGFAASYRTTWPLAFGVGALATVPIDVSLGFQVGVVTLCVGIPALGTFLGWVARRRDLLVEELQQQVARVEAAGKAEARLAVELERARIAREMHDIVAHGVSLMVVQAAGARTVTASDPRAAIEAMREVTRAGQEALREMTGLVETLAPGPPGPAAGPSGDGDGLAALVSRAGIDAQLTVEGSPPPGPIWPSVYRIVQEALTNVRKHSPGASAEVSVRHSGRAVTVEVTNSGAPLVGRESSPPEGSGLGLVGIRERAAVFGGACEAGPTVGGGFRLLVRLPLERAR